MNRLRQKAGATLVGVLVLATLVTITTYYFLTGSAATQEQVQSVQDQLTAQLQAAELLETLRAFNSASRLRNYLRTNPVNGTFGSYQVCAHINILNRANGSLLNLDNIATLGWAPLESARGLATSQNRFYQVRVFNIDTLQIDNSWCDTPFSREVGSVFARQSDNALFTSNPNWRFLITVGVSWVPKGKGVADTQEIALSTVLPVQ